MKNVCRNHQMCIEMASRLYGRADVSSVLSFQQRLCHIRHIRAHAVHAYVNVYASPNYHGTFYGNLCADTLNRRITVLKMYFFLLFQAQKLFAVFVSMPIYLLLISFLVLEIQDWKYRSIVWHVLSVFKLSLI